MSEYIIYLIVRKDLKMSKGKIGAQCGHAVENLIIRAPKSTLIKYHQSHHTKICLESKLADILDIENWCHEQKIPCHLVIDAGRTQLKPNTPTVLGIGPVEKKLVKNITQDLKLL